MTVKLHVTSDPLNGKRYMWKDRDPDRIETCVDFRGIDTAIIRLLGVEIVQHDINEKCIPKAIRAERKNKLKSDYIKGYCTGALKAYLRVFAKHEENVPEWVDEIFPDRPKNLLMDFPKEENEKKIGAYFDKYWDYLKRIPKYSDIRKDAEEHWQNR